MFGRGGRADPQPTEHVSVLLASTGGEFRPESIALSASIANRGLVGVLIIARIYGSSFGLPNPGLLPTKKERETAQDRVDSAIDQLLRLGIRADGQIMMTRNIASSISRVARARTADRVIVEAPEQGVIRGLLEGNFESAIRRKLRGFAEVTSAPRS